MQIALFSAHHFDSPVFQERNAALQRPHQIVFIDGRLSPNTVGSGRGYPAICVFVNDEVNRKVIGDLAAHGLKIIACRSAGYNHVDRLACQELGIRLVRVPAYSPHAVAEYAVGLLLSLNRKIHRAYHRVRELNFSLDGLVGFDLHGKTVGVVGTGRIGFIFAQILTGFGCKILAFDKLPNPTLAASGVRYVPFDELCRSSDVISLHVPLTEETYHLVNREAFGRMRSGSLLINTGRGRLIDTPALIAALKTGQLAGAALDVYEEEEGVFFEDLSDSGLSDDLLARLLTFPNVLVTSHQGFLTKEALQNIAISTLESVSAFEQQKPFPPDVLVV